MSDSSHNRPNKHSRQLKETLRLLTAAICVKARNKEFPEVSEASVREDRDMLDAFPSYAEVSKMLKVEPHLVLSFLNEGAGWFAMRKTYQRGEDIRIPPDLVLEAASHFRKTPISEVAQKLLDFAMDHDESHAGIVDDVIKRFFDCREKRQETAM